MQARGNQAAIQQRIDGNDRRVCLFDICEQEIADEFIRRRGLLLAEMLRANDRILFAVENFGREIKVAGALVERQQNNIFIEIRGKNNFFLKLPLTVVIVLLIFGFWILIPLVVIGLFLDIKFSVESKKVNTDKTNDILSKISKEVQNIKSKIKSGGK